MVAVCDLPALVSVSISLRDTLLMSIADSMLSTDAEHPRAI